MFYVYDLIDPRDGDFGREATTKRLLAEYGLEINLIENNA